MFDFAVAIALILLNGVFSLSELAIVSVRKARLKILADQGRTGAKAALALADDPGRFLSTVQIGITLIGIVAGAYSGAAFGQRLADIFLDYGLPVSWAEFLGYGVIISIITYLSVVIGELVPKNLALRNAEYLACLVAPLMQVVSRVSAPVVFVLDNSTKLIFKAFGKTSEPANVITDEEVRAIIAEAETAGVIETDEHKMIAGVLRLGDRRVRTVMTPRVDVEWIDINASQAEILDRLTTTTHSLLPVGTDINNLHSVFQVRDLIPSLLKGEPLEITSLTKPGTVIPETLDALEALAILRNNLIPMALVYDEYGDFEGLVTPFDILNAIAGAFRSDAEPLEEPVRREDGSWLIAGRMPVDELSNHLSIKLPEHRDYETAAGWILAELQHVPNTGEAVEAFGWRFEVVDLDGRRIDKILATRITAEK